MVAARTVNISPPPRSKRVVAKRRTSSTTPGSRTSWSAKLRPEMEPQVVADRRRGGRLLLPTALLIGDAIAEVPRGRVVTMSQLRAELARRFDADQTCPLMTGIFATILSGVVAEQLGRNRAPRWPIWRLVRDDGTLHPKWPLDALYRATQLRAEGVRLTRKSGHWAALDIPA
jgi:alkylated DNA nucleotide flippase Atl1